MAILIGSVVQRLATFSGISATAVASTPLYTVPTGRTAIITAVVPRVTAQTAATVPATAQIESSPAAADIFPSELMTGVLVVNDDWTFAAGAKGVALPAAATVSINITVAATATSQTLSVDVVGYLQ